MPGRPPAPSPTGIYATLSQPGHDAAPIKKPDGQPMSSPLDVMRTHPLPVELNSLSVDADGELRIVDPLARPIAFAFRWVGVDFTGGVGSTGEGSALRISGTVGPMPYSAESIPARRNAIAILFGSSLAPHVKLTLSPDQQIRASGEIAVRPPLTPKLLVAAAIRLALELRPYLKLLLDNADAGSGRGGAARTSAAAGSPPLTAGATALAQGAR
jgi:hypothetical protein